jgi:hypothetical protein
MRVPVMRPDIKKYPRTCHLRGSRFQHGDHDMEAVAWEELAGKHLIVEEKVDGANCGISFSSDGELLLQSRGHYLHGGPRERQFDLLKQWSAARHDELFCALGDRYVMYAEWLAAKHTYFYDALPHYFMEFDVLDTKNDVFLSTEARHDLLCHTHTAWNIVCPVLVLADGKFDNLKELASMLGRSKFITDERFTNLRAAAVNAGVAIEDALQHTDMDEHMEGLYVKWEEDGIVKGRYKYVRDTFTNAILDQEQHWHDRPIIQNKLAEGALERMFM